ncbi:MAG: peptidase U32 family protein [Enterococcus sp.]
MIEIITTVESLEQANILLESGVDTLYFGEEMFGLRLAKSFSREEQRELVELAHRANKKVNIAVNGIMHPDKMKKVPEYLAFLKEINVDMITVGDPGIIYIMKKNENIRIPFIYDGETLVTNARQINFWHQKGAQGAVLAREVPFGEMKKLIAIVEVPVEILVYGPTCIHQSKRPLLNNYFNYTKQTDEVTRERGLFLSEPKKPETHYSIYEDSHGTHIFANNDLNLINEVQELANYNFNTWKLDGLFTPEKEFNQIVQLFVRVKKAIQEGTWDEAQAREVDEQIQALHPENRELDTGFYYIDPTAIK